MSNTLTLTSRLSLALTHIQDYLELHAKTKPKKLALVSEGSSLTWSQLNLAVDRAASAIAAEVPYKDEQQIVGLLLPNGPQFIINYLALLKLGHIALPMDVSYKPLELNAIVSQMAPVAVISNHNYRANLANDQSYKLLISEDIEQAKESGEVKKLRLGAKDQIASLVFTSGTTGQPKAATYSHANHLWNIEVCSEVWSWDSDDTLLITLLFSHWYGLVMGLSGALYHGNTLYTQERFSLEKTLELLASGKISIFTHISSTYGRLLEAAGDQDYDLSGVRLCISGASALPPAVWQQFKDKFGQEILECYGSSESGRIASNLLDERIPGSPGRPLPGVKTKLSDDGELMVKSAGIFPGYWRNPVATAKALTNDGWWYTGDLAEIVEGRIILKGRVQERIRRFGYSISPRDIEWALYQNRDIKDAHVMGLQNSGKDDELVYFIVGSINEARLDKYIKSDIPFAWRPDRVIFLKKLPRTKNGKPQLGKLKAEALAGQV